MMRDRIGGRFCLAAALIAAAIAMTSPAAAQQVVAIVNGSPITAYDIDQRSKFLVLSTQKSPPRQEVLDMLIEEKIKIQEAGRYGMTTPKPELDRAIGGMAGRAGMSVEQFTQALAGRGVNIETVKSRMSAEIGLESTSPCPLSRHPCHRGKRNPGRGAEQGRRRRGRCL